MSLHVAPVELKVVEVEGDDEEEQVGLDLGFGEVQCSLQLDIANYFENDEFW